MFQEFVSEEEIIRICNGSCKCACYSNINSSKLDFNNSYKLINNKRDEIANLTFSQQKV